MTSRQESQPCYGAPMPPVHPSPAAASPVEARAPQSARPAPAVSRSHWQPPPVHLRRNGAEIRIPLTPPVEYDADGYPYADGAPMAHGTEHLMQMHYGFQALLRRYRHHPEVCVLSDVFISYCKGDPTAMVAPDVYVAFGTRPPPASSSYKLWEKPVPGFVLEVLSPGTAERDLEEKFAIYEAMGVAEYWVHDPHGRWVESGMRGYRWSAAGKYEEVVPHEANRWYSEVLGLELRDEGGELRFRDPMTGEDLPTTEEEADAREAAEDRAEQAESRAEQEASRSKQEARARQAAEARAEQEADARQTAEVRVARETESRRAAETRVAELEALLRARDRPA